MHKVANTTRGRILLIDDMQSNLDLLTRALEIHTYEVHAALNGWDGLKLAESLQPDLILLDIMMPEINGYAVCQALKAKPVLSDIPVIFLSALHETVDKLNGFKVGGVDYLTKPFHIEEVLARVATHITLYQQRKSIQNLLVEREAAQNAERIQRQLVSALLDTAVALNSTLNLDEVLERILANVGEVVPHDMAMLVMVEGEEAWVRAFRSTTHNDWRRTMRRFAIDAVPYLRQSVNKHQGMMIADTHADPLWVHIPGHEMLRSALGEPIIVDGQFIAALVLMAKEAHRFSEADTEHLQAFTSYASIALKNAQLYRQAQELATLRERQRIARELHDSVSQSLFSANAIAEAVPRIAARNPEKAQKYINDLSGLTRSAMAEMRALLMELRTESLGRSDLSGLLRQLCDAFAGRTNLDIIFDAPASLTLSPDAQVVFYRVAQEAMSNVIKHAHADHVSIRLSQQDSKVEMAIEDDGQGFSVENLPTNSFGLRIMHERAHSIGAELTIHSQVGVGTQVILKGTLS